MTRKQKGGMFCSLCLIGVALIAPLEVSAASFQVSPLRLKLSARQTTGVVWLTNNSSKPVVIQIEALAWSQVNGKDVYSADRSLIATPPIFRLAAGAKQVVRVGLRVAPNRSRETAFRLFLTQVPPPPSPGFQGLQIALRIGIPVFVEPATKSAAVLHWTLKRLSNGKIELGATNVGNAHVQIRSITLDPSAGAQALTRNIGGYLLPGTTSTWKIKLSATLPKGATLQVTAKTDQGKFQAQLSLE